jgi:hypothetical protein
MLKKLVEQIVVFFVLALYTSAILVVGWIGAITYESSAIKLERSVYSLIKFDKNFPPPPPGYEQCSSEPVPGETNFFIKLCQETPSKK